MKEVVLFSASWCSPCKQLKQWIKSKGYEVKSVDIDEDPELAAKAGVRGVPALSTPNGLFFGNEKIRPYLEKLND